MNNVTIRPASIDDIPAIKAVEVECKLSPWSIENYKTELERTNSVLLVAISHERRVVGFLAGRVIPESEAEIGNIGVVERDRNTGVGGRLLKAFTDRAVAAGATRVFLEVRVSNVVAIGFYEANGFRKVGLRRNFYGHPTEDGYTMASSLSEGRTEQKPEDA